MKAITVLMTVVAITWASSSSCNVTNEWDEYKALFNKIYRSQKEEDRRLKTYIKTKQKIVEHNWKYEKGYTAFTMEINKFADWFPEELKKLNGFKISGRMRWKDRKTFKVEEGVNVPEEMNWVKKGAVTSVKNQGACGSCYAFSAIGALEGLMYVTNKSVTDLSAQELVDCTTNVGNFGCDGGAMDHCFKYVKNRQGISTKNSYPYEAKEGVCRADRGKIRASCTGFVNLKTKEEDLRKAVGTSGPVAVAFGVSTDFMYYKCGVFDGECAPEPNHAMLAVGYGKDKTTGKDYWLVKNSWGVKWGEKGYVKIQRGVEKCGIHEYNSYPVYKKIDNKSDLNV